MSIQLMTEIWDNSKQSGTALLLLLALADHANENGLCWPSIPRLAQRARISERQCQRLLAELVTRQAIEVVSRSVGGRGLTSIYRIKSGAGNGDIQGINGDIQGSGNGDIQGINGDIQGSGNGDIQGINGDIQRANGDIAMSPEPPIEPPIEPPLTPPLQGGGGGGGVAPRTAIFVAAPAGRRIADPAFGAICNRYEENFGLLSESLLRQIGEMMEEFSQPLILAAMDTAIANEKRNLAYVRGVLRNNGNRVSTKGAGNAERRTGIGGAKAQSVFSSPVGRDPNAGYDHEWAMQFGAQPDVQPLRGDGLDRG